MGRLKQEQREELGKVQPHQVSLLVLHPRRPNQVVLLPPPVPEAPEEVVGEEAADGVPDDVDVDGLLYPEPAESSGKQRSELQPPSRNCAAAVPLLTW